MNLINKTLNKGLSIIESFFSKNWFNPFATVYLNFRSLKFSEAIHFPIWVFGRPKLMSLSGRIIIEAKIKTGMIWFNYMNIGSPSNMGVQSELNNRGKIIFKGTSKIRTGNRIVVGYGAVLEIGDKLIMGDMINIGCMKSITIGDNVRIAHRCQIFDSNYHYVANFNKMIIPDVTKPIKIGSYCWLCHLSLISSGANIPSYTIVSANSLVNKDFTAIPPKSIIGGIPAKLIATGFQLVNNINKENEISKFYRENPSSVYSFTDINDEWFNLL